MLHLSDSHSMNGYVSSSEDVKNGGNRSEVSSDQQRIQYLEQSIRFLHVQHQQLVSNLHDEVDQLKRKNRELHFCVVMMQQTAKTDNDRLRNQFELKNIATERDDDIQSTKSNGYSTNEVGVPHHDKANIDIPQEKKLDQLKLQFMEEENKHAKKQLDDARNLIKSLTERLRTTEHQLAIERTKSMSLPPDQSKVHSSQLTDSKSTSVMSSNGLPFNATVEPLLVHFPPQQPRAPTLQECQAIVKHLYISNNQQTHELNQLKIDLRDVLYSHKWTPDAYLLARSYIADDSESLITTLPRIPLKHATKKLPDSAYHVQDGISFPPMRPVVGNQAIERLKRTQTLHKLKTVKH